MRLNEALRLCIGGTSIGSCRSSSSSSSGAPLLALQQFVPAHREVAAEYIAKLDEFLGDKQILVLTGAGISTESGIPDYRSEGVGMYARTNHRPIQHIEFIRSHRARQRYWSRNFLAWPRFSAFAPNATHLALARFEAEGRLAGLITQNVDQLHRKAGSQAVLELHGHTHSVVCVGKSDQAGRQVNTCAYRVDRHRFQEQLIELNGPLDTLDLRESVMRPDGDVDVSLEFVNQFRIPSCPECGGNLKPDVVFFGDNVPKERTTRVAEMQERSDCLLVLGSSLQILSGYRIVASSHERGQPVVIVNIGRTRGDPVATIKLAAKCGDVVPKLFAV